MTTKQALPYGSWPSTITSQTLTQGLSQLNEPKLVDDICYWLESSPENKGCTVIMCQDKFGEIATVSPRAMNVRTRIHEYGGGSYCIHNNYAYFTNDSDQRVYRCALPNTIVDQSKTVSDNLQNLGGRQKQSIQRTIRSGYQDAQRHLADGEVPLEVQPR